MIKAVMENQPYQKQPMPMLHEKCNREPRDTANTI